MLFEYIAHVRSRSIHERKRFAFLFSSGATACVILVWLTVFFAGPDLNPSPNPTPPIVAESAQALADEGVFARFMHTVRGVTGTEEAGTEQDSSNGGKNPIDSDVRFKSAFSPSPSATPSPTTPTTGGGAPTETATPSPSSVKTPAQPATESLGEDDFVEGVLDEVKP